MSSSICLYAVDARVNEARSFSEVTGYAYFSGPAIKHHTKLPSVVNEFDAVIYFGPSESAHALSLLQTGKKAPGPVSASFMAGKVLHRLKYGGGKGQLIAKAVGLNKVSRLSVLDATAGLGRDAFVLASLGCELTMLERSVVVAKLLESALEEVQRSALNEDTALVKDVCSRMNLVRANTVEWLSAQESDLADVIYLDPMYPERTKSSLVKKEMKLFHSIVGEDGDDDELLAKALEKARFRVVVKRPKHGDSIAGEPPTLQLVGKSCRYDIYTLKALS